MSNAVASVTPIDRPRLAIRRTKAKPQTTWSRLQDEGYIRQIPNAVIRSTLGVSVHDKAVLMHLMSWCNWGQSSTKKRTIRPIYIRNVAEDLDVNEKTVRRAIVALEAAGLITAERDNSGQAFTYVINLDAVARAAKRGLSDRGHRVRGSADFKSAPKRQPRTQSPRPRTQSPRTEGTTKNKEERTTNQPDGRTVETFGLTEGSLTKMEQIVKKSSALRKLHLVSDDRLDAELSEHLAEIGSPQHLVSFEEPVYQSATSTKPYGHIPRTVFVGETRGHPAVYVGGTWERVNEHPGRCGECGHSVAAGTGVLVGKTPHHYHDRAVITPWYQDGTFGLGDLPKMSRYSDS